MPFRIGMKGSPLPLLTFAWQSFAARLRARRECWWASWCRAGPSRAWPVASSARPATSRHLKNIFFYHTETFITFIIQWQNDLYEGGFTGSFTRTISLQILGTGHATIPHIKAMDVPFHMGYGGLICSKALQSDRPKWGGMYADPRWTSLCKTVSKTMLEWGENRRCLSLSACHLVVSLSRACYHTSYERGHSGLPADMKIRTIV